MKNNKKYFFHKQQKSGSQLTPVDDAWNKMAALLDAEMPVAKPQTNKRAFSVSFSQLAISVVAAMVFVGGGTFIAIKTIETKKENYSSKQSYNYSRHDSIENKITQSKDSTIEISPDIQSNIELNQKSNKEEALNQELNSSNTSLSTTTTKTNTLHKSVSIQKANLNFLPTANTKIKTKNLNNITDSISKQDETNFIDSLKFQNRQLNSKVSEGINLNKEPFSTKIIANVSATLMNNSNRVKSGTKEKHINTNNENNNHLFVGLSGYNSILFSMIQSKNVYSFGEILTIGVRNTKYKLTLETGIGLQSIEYHVPYSRTLYTYQATGMYDSTVTVSSYKYSRYNIVVPFYVTKEILRYNNIFLDVKAGINTSFFISKQRLFNQIPVDINLVEDQYPVNSLNISFAFSPQFRWEISKKFSFNMNLGTELYLNSFFQNYSLKPIGINLSAGICYSL